MDTLFSMSLYYLSFTPLWLTVLFIDIKSIFENQKDIYTEIISVTFIILFGIICFFYLKSKLHISEKDTINEYELTEVDECKTITSEFLLSYILPLFAFDFTIWNAAVEFLAFFIVFGYLCIRHNVFSANIVIELLHYKMYKCILLSKDDKKISRTVISKNELKVCCGKTIGICVFNNDFVLEAFLSEDKS